VSLPPSYAPPSSHLRQRLIVACAGLALLAAAGWLALIIVTRIDQLFFPGQNISVPGANYIPGVGNNNDQGQINFLVMGLDRRPSEGTAPTRSDTMFVLTVDTKTHVSGILGIPRDLWVEIPTKSGSSYFENRINTAYATGELQGYSGGGASLVKQVVEHNLGISIDHYVVIDFQGFIKVIDALGGVDIYVEQQIDDPYYSETEKPGDYHPLHFKVGLQHMNGQTALDYSRTRFDSSDLDRIHRQQQVIFAAIDAAMKQNLVNVNTLVDLWSQYKDTIVTDVNDFQAPSFARLASQIDPTNIRALSLGSATRPWTTPEGAQVLLADKALVQKLVQAVITNQPVVEEAATVELQNASGADGLSKSVSTYLNQFGFAANALQQTTNANGSQALSEVIDFGGKQATAQRLAALLSVPPERVRPAMAADQALRTVGNADILVVLGKDAANLNLSIGSTDQSSP
jgi:polyisoprenyl-teichoic acid--peptidoglycan teichoic acid transferase